MPIAVRLSRAGGDLGVRGPFRCGERDALVCVPGLAAGAVSREPRLLPLDLRDRLAARERAVELRLVDGGGRPLDSGVFTWSSGEDALWYAAEVWAGGRLRVPDGARRLAVWSRGFDLGAGPAPVQDETWALARAREQVLCLEPPPIASAARLLLEVEAKDEVASHLLGRAELALDARGAARLELPGPARYEVELVCEWGAGEAAARVRLATFEIEVRPGDSAAHVLAPARWDEWAAELRAAGAPLRAR